MYCMLTEQKTKSQSHDKVTMKSEITNVNNIKKLWILKLILETGSLRKAAQKAKVSPAAISQTLSSLEKIYQKPLVLRKNNNSIEPTKEALKLIEWISPVFNALDNLHIKITTKVPPIAYINLGATQELSLQYTPLLFKDLKKVLPQLKLTVYSNRSDELLKMIRKGELCSAILVADDSSLEPFYVITLYEDEFGFFVKPELKNKNLEGLIEKHGLSMIRTSTSGLPLYMSQFLNQFSPKLKTTFLSDNFLTVSKIASLEDIVALLPKRIGKRENLVEVFFQKPLKHSGRHKVVLVSEKYCDKEEVDFIAEKLKNICKKDA